jgi:phosphoribosylaminoimidazole carboxylase PurE protein
MAKPLVGVIMGSDSDLEVMQRCLKQLSEFGISHEVRILSAHRTPAAVEEYAASAAGRGLKVLIAAAGMSAALGGALAARTTLPVIGVAMASGPLGGIDALLSTVQMPPGVPVACAGMAAAGATNAAVLAAEILALSDEDLSKKLQAAKLQQQQRTLEKDSELQQGK